MELLRAADGRDAHAVPAMRNAHAVHKHIAWAVLVELSMFTTTFCLTAQPMSAQAD